MKRIALTIAALSLAGAALATKPCPPPPCSTPNGTFDRAACDKKADWIALGHVTNLKHHPTDRPLLKDFAEFTFVVDKWIKTGSEQPREIPLRIGWCTNSEEMRGDGSGTFLFWGRNKADVKDAEWEFLHFERVEDAAQKGAIKKQ